MSGNASTKHNLSRKLRIITSVKTWKITWNYNVPVEDAEILLSNKRWNKHYSLLRIHKNGMPSQFFFWILMKRPLQQLTLHRIFCVVYVRGFGPYFGLSPFHYQSEYKVTNLHYLGDVKGTNLTPKISLLL